MILADFYAAVTSITTDVNGQAVYSLPEQAYKLRADHLCVKYWSEISTWEDRIITVDHGVVNVTVTQAGTVLAGARVYVFSSSGTYLGRSAATDSAGAATLTLPVNTYKLRIDYNGGKYWTDEVDLIQGQAVDAAYDLDTLALNLTANPHYARYDGEMPQKEAPPVLLASIGSLVGYDATPSQPETVYYINDHLGTPLKVIDNDNQVVWDGTYLPFGMVKDSVGGAQNLLRFPGQYADGETGLYYNWHRYYDPETGRYLTPDPIGLAGGINPFVYASNNPLNAIDPLGLLTYEQNRQRRKAANKGLFTKGVKIAASFAVGGEVVKNLSKVGLGVTIGTIIKERGALATLGMTGTAVNLVATAVIKGALISGAFYTGIEAGSNIGAYFDTLVDDRSSFLGVSPEFLEKIGFGSGTPNSNPCGEN